VRVPEQQITTRSSLYWITRAQLADPNFDLGVAEVSVLFDVYPKTVSTWIRDGKLKAFHSDGRKKYIIDRESVWNLLGFRETEGYQWAHTTTSKSPSSE
jgi:hypothetical protein